MALTIGKSPLARPPGGSFNFEIERLPRHLLYLEDFQRRIRRQLAGETIVESRRGKLLHETGKLPHTCPRRMSSRGHWSRANVARSILPEKWPSTTTSARGTAAYWMPRGATRNRPKASFARPAVPVFEGWYRFRDLVGF
jgi:uncharacterized protein (DUF427 family)